RSGTTGGLNSKRPSEIQRVSGDPEVDCHARTIGMEPSRRALAQGPTRRGGDANPGCIRGSGKGKLRGSVKCKPKLAGCHHARVNASTGFRLLLAATGALFICACQPSADGAGPQARPVRAMTVERREAAVPVTLTGRIEAEDEVALGF